MTTAALTLRRPAGRPGALGLGISTLWLSFIVLLPLAAVVVRSTDGGWDAFWDVVTSPEAIPCWMNRRKTSSVIGGPRKREAMDRSWVAGRQ